LISRIFFKLVIFGRKNFVKLATDVTVHETWKILHEFIVLQIHLNSSNEKYLFICVVY
jgi:hypothetical protein